MTSAPENELPPCTTRCPTVSISDSPTASSSAPGFRSPSVPRSRESWTASFASSSRNLMLLDPALSTRIRMEYRALVGPGPVADLRIVRPGPASVSAMAQTFIHHLLTQTGVTGSEPRDPIDHVDREME